MTINLQRPSVAELKPRMTVFGVGGGGGNAVNNMINAGLRGVDFVVANTDAQALAMSKADRLIQLGAAITEGLGAGAMPEVGRAAAEECLDEIIDHLGNSHMVFITGGMGGGTGTGAAPVVARAAREKGILTVGVVTKPFDFEGVKRMRTAEAGIAELQKCVDTLIVIPNQNLFRIANEKTTFAEAFMLADQVLYSGVASITDLMIKEGLINLDFADVRSVMHEMGRAMMGTGEATGDERALAAAEAAIANPLLDEVSMRGARGLLISITGGRDLTLFEVEAAASRVRAEIDADANIIVGAIHDESLEGVVRVSVVATGIDRDQEQVMHAQDDMQQRKIAPNRNQQAIPAQQTIGHAPKAQTVEQRPEAIMEVMAALEEEMDQPIEDDFAPRSQIFKNKPAVPQQAQQRVAPQVQQRDAQAHPQASAHAQVNRGQHRPTQQQTQQPMQQAGQQQMQQQSFEQNASHVDEMAFAQERHVQQERLQQERQVQQRAQQARMSDLNEFPAVNYEKTGHAQNASQQQGPMNLWKKLTKSFISHEETEPSARLEPAIKTPERDATMSREVTRRPMTQDAAVYKPNRHNEAQLRQQPHQHGNVSEEDQLEIPAFLRRQAN